MGKQRKYKLVRVRIGQGEKEFIKTPRGVLLNPKFYYVKRGKAKNIAPVAKSIIRLEKRGCWPDETKLRKMKKYYEITTKVKEG